MFSFLLFVFDIVSTLLYIRCGTVGRAEMREGGMRLSTVGSCRDSIGVGWNGVGIYSIAGPRRRRTFFCD